MINKNISNMRFGIEIEIPIKVEYVYQEEDPFKIIIDKSLQKAFNKAPKFFKWDFSVDMSCFPGLEIRTVGGLNFSKLNNISIDLKNIEYHINKFIDHDREKSSIKCGTHFHISSVSSDWDNQKIKIYNLWKNYIQKFQRLFISPRRYKLSIGEDPRFINYFQNIPKDLEFLTAQEKPDRFRSLNITTKQNTLEWRTKEWTLDHEDIVIVLDILINICANIDEIYDKFNLDENPSYKDFLKMINQDPEKIKKYIRKTWKKFQKEREELKQEEPEIDNLKNIQNKLKQLNLPGWNTFGFDLVKLTGYVKDQIKSKLSMIFEDAYVNEIVSPFFSYRDKESKEKIDTAVTFFLVYDKGYIYIISEVDLFPDRTIYDFHDKISVSDENIIDKIQKILNTYEYLIKKYI